MRYSIWLFAILFAACGSTSTPIDDKNPLRAYFFPLDSLSEGLVYEYTHEATGLVYDYRHCQTETDEKKNRYLVTTVYDASFQTNYLIRDWEIANGMIREEYKIFSKDSTGQTISTTGVVDQNSKAVYLFEPFEDSTASFIFKMDFQVPTDPNTFKLTREQFFKGFTTYSYKGKDYEAAEFTYKEFIQIDNRIEGGAWDVERNVREVFAKGLGLVYHHEIASHDPTTPIIYTLTDRFPMKYLVKKGLPLPE